ncbi:MAG: hypothetical protein AAGC56_14845 [Pseudomonadota bacterium]
MEESFAFLLGLLELVFSNIFVVFFLFLFILPMLARRRRHADLIQAFSVLQRKRKSRLITLVHRLEPMGFLGIPQFGYIDLNDAEEVIEAIRTTPRGKPLEIMLHTPGGLVLAALQIARAVKAHDGPTRVYVPHFAMSGGTMIALAADQIVMTDHAIMGPIDPQIDGLPAASIMRVRDSKSPDAVEDYTLLLADIGEMAIEQVKAAARELLSGAVSENAAIAIAEQLATGQWNHDYPIYASHAKALGLPVSTDMPKDIMDLMAMFPNTLKNRSGATYLPESGAVGRLLGRGKPSGPSRAASAAPASDDPRLGAGVGGRIAGPTVSFGEGRDVRGARFGPWNPRDLGEPPTGPRARRPRA